MNLQYSSLENWAAKVVSVIATICTIGSAAWNILRRSPSNPAPSPTPPLRTVALGELYAGLRSTFAVIL